MLQRMLTAGQVGRRLKADGRIPQNADSVVRLLQDDKLMRTACRGEGGDKETF